MTLHERIAELRDTGNAGLASKLEGFDVALLDLAEASADLNDCEQRQDGDDKEAIPTAVEWGEAWEAFDHALNDLNRVLGGEGS